MFDRPPDGIRRLLITRLLIPFAPDDLVCLVAGLTDFLFKEDMKILLLLNF